MNLKEVSHRRVDFDRGSGSGVGSEAYRIDVLRDIAQSYFHAATWYCTFTSLRVSSVWHVIDNYNPFPSQKLYLSNRRRLFYFYYFSFCRSTVYRRARVPSYTYTYSVKSLNGRWQSVGGVPCTEIASCMQGHQGNVGEKRWRTLSCFLARSLSLYHSRHKSVSLMSARNKRTTFGAFRDLALASSEILSAGRIASVKVILWDRT